MQVVLTGKCTQKGLVFKALKKKIIISKFPVS